MFLLPAFVCKCVYVLCKCFVVVFYLILFFVCFVGSFFVGWSL